ncbi:MAG: hypothetical protein JW863_01315 [Chitinispirillaceae bacterium]|nr:hypothetical protein [Chitinispirillaceae bacterium]
MQKQYKLAYLRYGVILPLLLSCPVLFAEEASEDVSSDTTMAVTVPAAADTAESGMDSSETGTATDALGSLSSMEAEPGGDSLIDTSTAVTDSSTLGFKQQPVAADTAVRSATPGDLQTDTAGLSNGIYFSAGIGWSLGGFELFSLWENSLPDSLSHLGLSDTSFIVPFDSTERDIEAADTALLSFSVKEAPVIYTMSFPAILSLVSIRDERKLSLSLSGSWMRKVFTGTVSAIGDTLGRKTDFKESVNVYAAMLSFQWGHTIPDEYFSIEGMERSFFTAGLDIAPLVAVRIRRSATSTGDTRFTAISRRISKPSVRFMRGGAAGIRLGISMLKRLNARSATDFGIWYSVLGYGYFLEDNNGVSLTDIDPTSRKENRPLFWVSNRLELSFALLRNVKR